MKRKFFRGAAGAAVLLMAVVMLLASCEGNPAQTASSEPFSLDVIIAEGTMGKAISGYGGDGSQSRVTDITDYSLTIFRTGDTSPYVAETFFEKTKTGYDEGQSYHTQKFTVRNIVAGSYDFRVRGFISGSLVAENTYTHNVTSGIGTIGPLELKDLIDEPAGEITINLNMPTDLTDSSGWKAGLSLSIYEGSGISGDPVQTITPPDFTGTAGNYSASYTLKDGTDRFRALDPGLYTVVAVLTDRNDGDPKDTYTAVELMRLFPGLPAAGSISFTASAIESEDVGFSIKDSTGTEIVVPLGGTFAVKDGSFGIGFSQVMPSDITITFYMDGVAVPESDDGGVYATRDDAHEYSDVYGENHTETLFTFRNVDGSEAHNFTCILVKEDTAVGAGSFSFTTAPDGSDRPVIVPAE